MGARNFEKKESRRPEKMRVALITDTFSTGGGLEHLFQLTRELRDVRFSLYAKGGNARDKFLPLENVELFDKGYGTADILRTNPDVIHVHHLKPLLCLLRNPRASFPIPVMFTLHGLHAHKFEFIGGSRGNVLYFFRTCLERYLFGRINRVIAVSRDDESFLKEVYGLSNTLYIPNGINTRELATIHFSGDALKSWLNVPRTSRIFLTVARFDYQKGHDILIEAIHMGREFFQSRDIRFLFVGEGKGLRAMKRLAAKKKVVERITFLGERDDVLRIMKASDLFILPSRWEGMSIALLEALCCGLPVVASDACGNREVAGKGGGGLLFENENARDLFRVLQEVVIREMWKTHPGEEAGITFREEFDCLNTCRKLKALYQELSVTG